MILLIAIALIIGSAIGAFLTWLDAHDFPGDHRPYGWTLWFIPIVIFSTWIIIAEQYDWRIERELTATSITIDGAQCVIFNDDNETHHYNINREFGRTFEDDTEFKLIFRDSGPYAGMWYYVPPVLEINNENAGSN